MHPVLERQLKKQFGSLDAVPADWRKFLEIVSETYLHADEDRMLSERSLEISSRESIEKNHELKEESSRLHERARELQDAKTAVLNVLEDEQRAEQKLQKREVLLNEVGQMAK